MQTFDLKDGDIYVDKGQIAIVDDKTTNDQVAQTIGTRLKTILGEYFYDINFGLPYWDVIANASNIDILNVAMKNSILGTSGVVKINSFQSNLDTIKRIYSVSFYVTTKINDTNNELNISKIFEF